MLTTKAGFIIARYEARQTMESYLARNLPGTTFAQFVEQIGLAPIKGLYTDMLQRPSSSADFEAARQAREVLRANYAKAFADAKIEALLMATTLMPAPPQADVRTTMLNGREVPTHLTLLHNTFPAAVAGLPSISVPVTPVGTVLPIGLQLDGPEGTDRRLLAIALALKATQR
jgi:indoleacetamide hydrolase